MPRPRSKPRASDLLSQREAIVSFGRLALRSDDLSTILHEACRLTGAALRTNLAKVMQLEEDGATLLVIAGIGWDEDIVGKQRTPTLTESSEGYALRTGLPAVSENIANEERFDYAEFLQRNGVKAMVNVVIPGPDGKPPFGLLEVDSRKNKSFTPSDIEFLQSYANLIGAAVERHRYQAELAEALRVQEQLFAELQHRIRNNLAVISGLLRLKAGRASHPAVKQEISEVIGQIDVLKDIYNHLFASGRIEEVDLAGYLSSLCAGIVNFHAPQRDDVRVETRCDSVSVEADLAVPLGLVTNEFVTNSLKHAGGAGLSISLRLSREPDALLVTLADDGKGIGDALQKRDDQTSGTGLRLIEGLLGQINGAWEWSSENGTRLSIRILLSRSPARPALQ